MSKTILIVANGLCRQLGAQLRSGAVTITMLGASDTQMYQPGLLYVPFGRMPEYELVREQSRVLDRRWAQEYDGKAFCSIETGFSTSIYVLFNYQTPPAIDECSIPASSPGLMGTIKMLSKPETQESLRFMLSFSCALRRRAVVIGKGAPMAHG